MIKKPIRKTKVAILVASLAAMGWLAHSMIVDYQQEACSFGPVTNEKYRELKRSIAAKMDEPQFGAASDMNPKFTKAFNEFVNPLSNIYEKIAITHAILRLWGAQYKNTDGKPDDNYPFQYSNTKNRFVTYHYYIPVRNPFELLLFLGQGWTIFVHIANPNAEVPKQQSVDGPIPRGTFKVYVSLPSTLLDGWLIPRTRGVCPPVPRLNDAPNFTSEHS